MNPVLKLGTWSYIVRYLIHHILSHFPPKIREFGFIIDQSNTGGPKRIVARVEKITFVRVSGAKIVGTQDGSK